LGEESLHIYITKSIYIGSASLKTLPLDLEPPLQGKQYGPPYSNATKKRKDNVFPEITYRKDNVFPKIRIGSPNTREEDGQMFKSKPQVTKEKTKSLPKTARTSKVVNPLTLALRSPFIGRRRDFYIPTIPFNSKNIPSVNTHTNVFYISYIYKPATS
jgi:hypothetical protein